jgi:hypothetical protein
MERRDSGDPMDEDSDHGDTGADRREAQASPPGSTPSGAAVTASGESPGPAGSISGATAEGTPVNAATASLNKRRRGLGIVTPTACRECRKKRAKVYLMSFCLFPPSVISLELFLASLPARCHRLTPSHFLFLVRWSTAMRSMQDTRK